MLPRPPSSFPTGPDPNVRPGHSMSELRRRRGANTGASLLRRSFPAVPAPPVRPRPMPPTPFVFDADGQFVPPPPRPISTPSLPPGFTSERLENFVELQSTRNVLAAVKAAEQEKEGRQGAGAETGCRREEQGRRGAEKGCQEAEEEGQEGKEGKEGGARGRKESCQAIQMTLALLKSYQQIVVCDANRFQHIIISIGVRSSSSGPRSNSLLFTAKECNVAYPS